MRLEILDEIIYVFLSLFDQPRFFSMAFKKYCRSDPLPGSGASFFVTFGPCYAQGKDKTKKVFFFAHAHHLCPILNVLGSESV